MDARILWSTFAAIFLAELGDKTQIATLSAAAGSRSRLSVFLGAALALVAASALAVLVGDGLTRWIPTVWIRRAAAVVFLGFGCWLLFSGGET